MVGKNIIEVFSKSEHELLTPSSKQLDLTNFSLVEDFFRTAKPDAVIHAAGLVGGIQANIARPVDFLCANAQMGMNIVQASRQACVEYFLNLSSSCVYPKDVNSSLTEDMILSGKLEPTNEGYALAKILSSRLCEYVNKEDASSRYKTIIPCNLYGRFDKFSIENSHMIPAVIRKLVEAKRNRQEIVDIWGDGQARREFMYAGDLAEFILYCLENFDSIPQNTNVGLGYDYSINEYYQTIAEVVGYTGGFEHDLSKPVGMKRKLLDVSNVERMGWKASTSLKDGVRKTVEFYISDYNEK